MARPTVGVLAGWQVFTGTPDSFLGRVYRGIQAAARDRNCNLLLACGINSGQPAWPLLSADNAFIPVGPWNTDGLIIVSPLATEAGDRFTRDLIAEGFPFVYAGDRDTGPAVVPDNEGGIRQAIAHLVDHGHREIAFVAGRLQAEHGDTGIRLRAFQAELREFNLPFDPGLVAYGMHTYEGGRQAIQQIVESGRKFTAVVASNDRSAIGAMDGLKQMGFVIPQDIAVVGFDDRLEARAQVPSLTTVHYPMFGLGYQAVEMLLQAIRGEAVEGEIVRIPTRLVVRESCGCLPGISAGVKSVESKKSTQPVSRKQVISQLAQLMTSAIHNESLELSQQEVAYLARRLAEAFLVSLEQKDPQSLNLMVKQILERVANRGDDLFAWQAAVTILRDRLPLLCQVVPDPPPDVQIKDMLDHLRVAISESARWNSTRTLLSQASESDQVSLMTSKLFTAHNEHEIYEVIASDLPAICIQSTRVVFYEAESDDPVACGVLQNTGRAAEANSGITPEQRFRIRQFPPEGLYPADQAFQLALLPLTIWEEVCGFVAFSAGNLNPCADIVRQLGAALRGVWLYREAVDARRQAEEGRRMAEEANRMKSRFLSIVSHELRTPLNLISGLSRILLDEYEAGKQKKHIFEKNIFQEDLQRIYLSSQHLDGLIRDVLDLTSSDIGQLKLVNESLDLHELLEVASAIGQQMARDKGLEWREEIAPGLPRVWGDRTRLQQVTLNLINNALKFTSRGEIVLTARLEKDHVVVSVADTGLGIPLHEQGVIFDEFRQSERTAARGYGGLGLGLAICKKLVEMHGGEIGVCSSGKEGEGSMFYYSLPILEMLEEVPVEGMSSPAAQRVLLLVKDREGGKVLHKELIERGYSVELCLVEAQSDWLASLLRAAPDVVALDLALTSERGWDILKIMKENPATRNIPVLFFSIEVDAGLGSLLEIDYLTKPVAKKAITEILSSKGLFNFEAHPGFGKTILVVDDEPAMLNLYTRILEGQLPGHRLLLARDGRQALKVMHKECPSLVMLDLMMPEMDGFTVLEEMRKSETTRNIPVVVITGQSLTQEDLDRLNTGVVSVLGKGIFSVEEIVQHLSGALEQKRRLGSETQQIARKAMAYIHTNYAEPISRSNVAAYVGLSERHLARCFHHEVGMTPITYLNRFRVKQAKALLDAGEKGITEIAVEVGFSSSSYFTRVFRDEVGISPRSYLRSRSTNTGDVP